MASTSRLPEEIQFVIDSESEEEQDPPPAYEALDAKSPIPPEKDASKADANIHYIHPSDTLTGIAFSYNIPARQLAKLNKINPAALTTQPSLLHTRPFLLLPPGLKSRSAEPLRDQEAERKRLQVVRFQRRTKCTDQKVAEYYLAEAYRRREAGGAGTDESEFNEAVQAYHDDLAFEERDKAKGKWTGPRAGRRLGF